MLLRLNFGVTHEEKHFLYFDSGIQNMCCPSKIDVFWRDFGFKFTSVTH